MDRSGIEKRRIKPNFSRAIIMFGAKDKVFEQQEKEIIVMQPKIFIEK